MDVEINEEMVVDGNSTENDKISTENHSENSAKSKQKMHIQNQAILQTELDPNFIINVNKHLVRVEYPGEVQNMDKSIETLGGLESIGTSVADHTKKIELYFHPKNRYNRPCYGEKDFKPGILIKVNMNPAQSASKVEEAKLDYEVEGVCVMNFTFNRLCDFQYLPLVCEEPETKSSTPINIYEKILPSKLPDSKWIESEQSKNMEQFLLPSRFSNYDTCQSRSKDKNDKTDPTLKMTSENPKFSSKQKSVCRIFRKARTQTSIFANFVDTEVPMGPSEVAVRALKNRNLETQVARVKQLFEERPIWTKAAIRYITGLTDEHSKVILPVVAYHFSSGPWRITWVKFGYDPRKDPKARIYQILDYRIKAAATTKMKVTAKRHYASKSSPFLPSSHLKMSLKHDMSTRTKPELDERFYVLRPMTVPPARQMFYQLCDLLLPEIQDKISRLPEASTSFCHPKNGFLPEFFIENCREIVNRYVLEAIQKEILEDEKALQESAPSKGEKSKESPLDYYNQMLSNIKKGLYKNVVLTKTDPQGSKGAEVGGDVELISLSSDEEYTVGDILQDSIPETLEANEDHSDENESDSSDEADIDMEAAQEINDMILQFNDKM